MKICAEYLHITHKQFKLLPKEEQLKFKLYEEYSIRAEEYYRKKSEDTRKANENARKNKNRMRK